MMSCSTAHIDNIMLMNEVLSTHVNQRAALKMNPLPMYTQHFITLGSAALRQGKVHLPFSMHADQTLGLSQILAGCACHQNIVNLHEQC